MGARTDIVKRIEGKFGLSKADCRDVLREILTAMEDIIAEDGYLRLDGFGVFKRHVSRPILSVCPDGRKRFTPPRVTTRFFQGLHIENKIYDRLEGVDIQDSID